MRTVPMLRRPHPKRLACPVMPHAHPLAREFFTLLSAEGVAMTDVALRAGLSLAALVKWKTTHTPNIVSLNAALNVLGYELRIVRRAGGQVGS